MGHEDAMLIRRFRDGDEEAFRILLERCRPAVQTQVGQWMPSHIQRRVSVADVLQEARLVAFQRRADFEDRGDGSFRRWLLGIASYPKTRPRRNSLSCLGLRLPRSRHES